MHAINILDQSYNNTNNIENIIKICEHLRNRGEKIFDLGICNYFNTFNRFIKFTKYRKSSL